MAKKLVFVGCSYTAGVGWKDTDPEESFQITVKDSPHLYVNLCYNNIERLNQLELVNIAKGGASNTEIFNFLVRYMSECNDIDTIFCQWTAGPRYNWNVGFELWDTSESLITGSRTHEVRLNRGDRWSRKYINDLTDRMKVLHHLHWEILKVVEYTNIIYNLAKKLHIPNVFFINGLCPWDKNYFVELQDVLPESYTEFTKKQILNIETRDDTDIFALYKLAHQHYRDAGGVKENMWVNLYNSFKTSQIDYNFDKKHPGIKSNQLYYNQIKTFLESHNN